MPKNKISSFRTNKKANKKLEEKAARLGITRSNLLYLFSEADCEFKDNRLNCEIDGGDKDGRGK